MYLLLRLTTTLNNILFKTLAKILLLFLLQFLNTFVLEEGFLYYNIMYRNDMWALEEGFLYYNIMYRNDIWALDALVRDQFRDANKAYRHAA